LLESCHSTWAFDPAQGVFRRTVRDLTMSDGSAVTTQWRPYFGLDLDWEHGYFVVWLTPDHSRLLRARRHTPSCALCGETVARTALVQADCSSNLADAS
jgi:hypothetical protein